MSKGRKSAAISALVVPGGILILLWLFRKQLNKLLQQITGVDTGALLVGGSMAKRNNPLNIKYVETNQWKGQIGSSNGFVIFDTPTNGARAALKLLQIYNEKHQLYTVKQIVSRWDSVAWATYVPLVVQFWKKYYDETITGDYFIPNDIERLKLAFCMNAVEAGEKYITPMSTWKEADKLDD